MPRQRFQHWAHRLHAFACLLLRSAPLVRSSSSPDACGPRMLVTSMGGAAEQDASSPSRSAPCSLRSLLLLAMLDDAMRR
eukprot:5626792-Pleurochrysis_carterae.AAC.1